MRKEKENKKRRKLLPAMLAVALAAVMIVPMGSGLARAAEGGGAKEDKSESYSLTVNLANEEFNTDLKNAKLMVYQLAEFKDQNSSYSWDLTKTFADYDTDGSLETLLDKASAPGIYSSEKKAELNNLYQELAGKTTLLIKEKDIEPTEVLSFGNGKSVNNKGLYVVVPVLGDSIKLDDNNMVTVETEDWIYTFNPLILSVPTKKVADDGSIGTAAEYGDWIDAEISLLDPSQITEDVQAVAKVDRIPNVTSISIVKDLLTFETKDPATFVYSIKAVRQGEQVYSNVVAIHMSVAGTSDPKVIDNIPVNSEVTVTEIYTGASYTISSDKELTKKAVTDATQNVFIFENDYDHTYHGGGGIENQFTKPEGASSFDVNQNRSKDAWAQATE